MSLRIGLSLCLVVLLLLSGCNAFSSGEAAETPQVTPADVPTEEPRSVRGFAPGLTRQGVVDPIALGRAHEAVLTNTSYTVLSKRTVRYLNGTVRMRGTTTTRVVAPADRYYMIREQYRPAVDDTNHTSIKTARWSDGTRELVAISRNNNTTYKSHELSLVRNSYIYGLQQGKRFFNLFSAIDTHIINNTIRNETTLYRLASTKITQPDYIPGVGSVYKNPRNLTFHALIDSHGLVHKYRLAYTATFKKTNRSTPVRIERTVRYTRIGNTTVERPPWYRAANSTTPERSPR
jgi:hypothetical protein